MPTLEKPTSRQTWAVFCLSGYDIRNCKLSKEDVSDLIAKLKNNDSVEFPKEAVLKKKIGSLPTQDYKSIWEEALQAGEKALKECVPTPMVVAQHENMADDNSPIEKAWHVPDGVCGFASVVMSPGTHSFIRWLKKNKVDIGKHYYGGMSYWISEGGQSYEKKCAYAKAMCNVLAKIEKLTVYVDSRLD